MKKEKLIKDLDSFVEFFSPIIKIPSYELIENGEFLSVDFGGFGFDVSYSYDPHIEEFSSEDLEDNFETWITTYDSGSYWEPPSSDVDYVKKYTTLFHTLRGCFDLLMDEYWRSYGEFEWGREEIEFEQIDFKL